MRLDKYHIFFLLYLFSFFSIADNHVAVTIYDGEAYTGESLKITGDTPNLGVLDKKMSSFQISPGYTVRFFLEKDFGGGYYSVQSYKDDISIARNLNDKIRSISVLAYDDSAPVAVTLYDDDNFLGKSLQVKGDMAALGNFSAKTKSFKVEQGWEVRFFDQPNFQGNYFTRLPGDTDNADWGKHNVGIKSVKILKRGDGHAVEEIPQVEKPVVVTIYTNKNYQGKSLNLTEDVSSIGKKYGKQWDNQMESFKVTPGYEVRFYEHDNFQGRYFAKNSNSPDQIDAGNYTNIVSSMQITTRPADDILQGYVPSEGDPPFELSYLPSTNPLLLEVFSEPDYGGHSYLVRGTTSIFGKVAGRAIPMGSVKIHTSDYSIMFFTEPYYAGNFWTRTSSSDQESPSRMIKSILFVPKRPTSANLGTYYSDANFKGSTGAFTEGAHSNLGSLSGKISSYRMKAGWAARLYDQTDLKGDSVTIGMSQPTLSFNDRARSMLVFPDPCPVAVMLWKDKNYQGSSFGVRRSTSLLWYYGWDSIAHSWHLTSSGYSAKVYDHENYQGYGRLRPLEGQDDGVKDEQDIRTSSVKVLKRPNEHANCEK